MNKQSWTILVVVLALMAGSAAFLATQRSRQRLGQPGVRVIAQPTYDTRGFGANGTNHEPSIARSNSVFLPKFVLDYLSEAVPVQPVVLSTLPADTLFGHRFYRGQDGFEIDCQVVLMGADRSSIHQPRHCLGGNGLKIVSEERATVPMTRPHPYELPVKILKLRGETVTSVGSRQPVGGVFVYWYVADGQLTADHGQRLWLTARDLVTTGVLQRWAYVICYTVCPHGEEEAAYERLKDFIAASVPEFQITAGPPIQGARAKAD